MGRTKKDFLSYANQYRNSAKLSQSERSKIDYASSDARDETTSDNVWRTDLSSYQSDEIVSGTTETEGSSSGVYSATEQGEDTGTDGVYSSGDGTSVNDGDTNGYYDIPIRNIDTSTYQSSQSVSGTSKRVVKTRKTGLDKVAKMFGMGNKSGNKLPPKVTKKAVAVTRKLLTIAEVSKNRPILINILTWTSDHFDDGITAVTKGHKQVEIWSNMEYADIEILADFMLGMGQKSEWMASRVRQVLDYYDKVQAGAITIPRLAKTIVYLFTTGIDIRMF